MLVSKPVSLVEQKKQQWAKEREEMSQLYLPWGSGERAHNRLPLRNQFASSLELHKDYDYQEPIQRQRSPSLPPIHNVEEKRDDRGNAKEVLNRNVPNSKRFSFYDEDGEGDTSGYGSETVNHMSIRNQTLGVNNHHPVMAWQQDGNDNRRLSDGGRSNEGVWSRSPRSTDEGRPRWGDRGVATGRLWEPTTPNSRLPQMPNQKKGTPSWVERGLNMIGGSSEVLVIDQSSSTHSGIDCDRLSCNGSDEGRSFLRGQNVPIEPEIKAQRESKRIKALELQSAILNQLEDREKRRMEERERKLREERLEEMRLKKQQEEDMRRLEEERLRNEEKQRQEQRKLEALKKALEDAERKAREEKEKRFMSHKPIVEREVMQSKTKEACVESLKQNEGRSPTRTNRTYDVHSAQSQKKESHSHQTTEFNSPRSLSQGNVNLYIHSVPPVSLDSHFNIVPIGINGNAEILSGQPNSLQLAVIVPQNLGNNLYSLSLNSLNNVHDSIDPTEKILTPRKYRAERTKDAFTQTDPNLLKYTVDKKIETDDRNIDKDYSNIDENAPQDHNHNSLKKERRMRSEERYKKELENRPKWGVNRPAAQYKKQSEKDPFYSQKRKLRLKARQQARQYNMSQSSDDSRSPSPPTRIESKSEGDIKPRNSLSQSYWRNKRLSQDSTRNNMSSNDNSLLEPTVNSLLLNETDTKKSPKMSPNKRITLSQKFINDKYGNRKLWIDDVPEKSFKSNALDGEYRKKIIDQLNSAKRDSERSDDHILRE